MKSLKPIRLLTVVAAVLGSVGTIGAQEAAKENAVDYLEQVKPVLRSRCFACHGALRQEANLRLDAGRLMRDGGDSGAAVAPSDPGSSLLLSRIAADDASQRMPPEGEPLTADQIQLVRRWIEQGAKFPDDEKPEEDPRDHWAFRKLVRPPVPEGEFTAAEFTASVGASPSVASSAFEPRNPIDAFLDHELTSRGLTARPAAAKHVVLRRVYLDLIGLPPTRDELRAFLADESPEAYDRVVDRLLDSPQYGERWGRHWMDVWRYSDWYGRRHVPDVWNSAPQVWRWRDWIVRSLNEDKGYDRMIGEMLAADEIAADDPAAAVATGYLVRNWYALNPNDWMRNTLEHTGKAFLGLTFNCAHCHDHKYDPITQDDYFRLRAFFEPMYVRQDRWPGEADPGPYQDYGYSVLRKIQHLGAVRVFDQSPDAPTWFYTGGDERNRVAERGSMTPGVPQFLAESLPKIEPVELPPRAFYPGLHPDIQKTVLTEARAAVAAADSALLAARAADMEVPSAARDRLAQAEAAYAAAFGEAKNAGRITAIAGQQSVVFDATAGRRIIQNRLAGLKRFPDGFTVEFQLLLATDTHFNFQFAKDVEKGLTAGYVAFENGRIRSYQPGGFTEFEVGQYDFASGQNRLHVQLAVQPSHDRALLTIRSLAESNAPLLVENTPVALNGWNPVGDPTKGILFDARTGSVAAIDEVVLSEPAEDGATATADGRVIVERFAFEPSEYPAGRDVVGLGGWEASSLCVSPATSILAAAVNDPKLAALQKELDAARRAARLPELRIQAAEARCVAASAELASVEARVAADRAKYSESNASEPVNADPAPMARAASRAEREAALRKFEADLLAHDAALAAAESKPAEDSNRAKEIDAAAKLLEATRQSLAKAQATAADDTAETYAPFSTLYPQTSTGRRRALADWIVSPDNPLTARVALNHLWMRHFHSPLVASVYDFGRNGAPPTHPQLIDWLAVELVESGWSMKHLHRLIVTSSAYRRVSSAGDADRNLQIDPENRYLWRMNTGRMETEILRDSLLYCGGKLDLTQGGQPLDNSQSLTTFRRSLYYEVFPEEGGASQFSVLFDPPNPLECYRRTRSIVPQQALALTNSDLVHQVAREIVGQYLNADSNEGRSSEPQAESPSSESPDTPFIDAMFEQVLGRTPTEAEREICREYLKTQQVSLDSSATQDASKPAREGLVRALLNHNDFVTIR